MAMKHEDVSVEKSESLENVEDPMKNYEFDGHTYVYTDKTTNNT